MEPATDREDLSPGESVALAECADLPVGRQTRRELQRVVHRAVHRNAVGPEPAELVRHHGDAIDGLLEDLRMRRFRPGRNRRRWQGMHFAPRDDVVLRPAARLSPVEAGELLVAEGHHVVSREHDPRPGLSRLGQSVVSDVRVDEMGVDHVRRPLVQHGLERPIDRLVVQRHPGPEAHRVVRVPRKTVSTSIGEGVRRVPHGRDGCGETAPVDAAPARARRSAACWTRPRIVDLAASRTLTPGRPRAPSRRSRARHERCRPSSSGRRGRVHPPRGGRGGPDRRAATSSAAPTPSTS